MFNVTHSVINRLLKEHYQTGCQCRKRMTTNRGDHHLLQMARQNPFLSSNRLCQWVDRRCNKRLIAGGLKRSRLTGIHRRKSRRGGKIESLDTEPCHLVSRVPIQSYVICRCDVFPIWNFFLKTCFRG